MLTAIKGAPQTYTGSRTGTCGTGESCPELVVVATGLPTGPVEVHVSVRIEGRTVNGKVTITSTGPETAEHPTGILVSERAESLTVSVPGHGTSGVLPW